MADLNAAFAELRSVVGEAHFSLQAAELEAASTATFATTQRVLAIVRPKDREQVQEVLRIATRARLPVYPVSSGKNWGYGSRVPTSPSALLLDLRRLDRIVDYDEKLGHVTVEAGVTQRQLYDFLCERGGRFWIDATGASPETSLVGNALERGFGHTPYGEHAGHVCNFEVVLPTGECVHTGFERYGHAPAGPVYKWGVGPHLEGLFSQGNLGVVTRMTLWLMPAPETFEAYYFRVDARAGLANVVDALRPLRLSGSLRSAIHLANDYKLVSGTEQYPWAEAENRTPLPDPVLARIRRTWRIGAWNGSGGIYGSRSQVAATRKLVVRALAGRVDNLQFLDDRKLAWAARFTGIASRVSGIDLHHLLPIIRATYGLMKGIPTAQALTSAYWRKRMAPPADPDPDRDRCGLMWCAPVAPIDGAHAMAIDDLARSICLAHGFEPASSFTLVTERAMGCVISLTYDRDVPGEDARAEACYRQLLEALTAKGYYPYRIGIQSMALVTQGEPAFGALLQKLKQAVDPANVLAPGRYLSPGEEP